MTEKVLLVDDDTDFLDIMSERMRTRGMEVDTAASGKEALEKLETQSYDAVLLDLMMPEMGGLEALQIIKDKKPEIQVILLTGHASVSKGVEAIKLGAMDFVLKPAKMEELTEKIKQASVGRMILVEKRTQAKIKKILTGKGW